MSADKPGEYRVTAIRVERIGPTLSRLHLDLEGEDELLTTSGEGHPFGVSATKVFFDQRPDLRVTMSDLGAGFAKPA